MREPVAILCRVFGTNAGSKPMPPPYCYDYPRPAVTVDLVVFAIRNDALRLLLIRRKHDPFAGHWALPGGFLEVDEPIEAGARRELQEETGLVLAGPVDFLGVYGNPGRDPRGRTISLAHVSIIRGESPEVVGGDDAAEAAWLPARGDRGPLAFDHDEIVSHALRWLEDGVRSGRHQARFLPESLDETEARSLLRIVLGDQGTPREAGEGGYGFPQ